MSIDSDGETRAVQSGATGPDSAAIFSEEALDRDPHDCISRLREQTPVWRRTYGGGASGLPLFTVFPHQLAQSIFKHPNTRQFETELLAARGVTTGPLVELYSNGMLACNGEVHRRRRRPLAQPFSTRSIEAMRPLVAAIVREEMKRCAEGCEFDVASTFARDLPALVLCHMMGIPGRDIDRFVGWVQQAAPGLSTFGPDEVRSINEGTAALIRYVRDLLRDRAADTSDFLGTYLASAASAGLSDSEVEVQIAGTILAAAETTRVSISIAFSLLLDHPAAWREVKASPDLVEAAVKETMRFEPAVGTVPRLVTADFDLGGVRVSRGSVVSASVIGALRDPLVFEAPERFDVHRRTWPSQHLVFGGGAHRCLGEALAMVEIVEAVRALIDLLPDASLARGPIEVRGFSGIRRIGPCIIRKGAFAATDRRDIAP